MTESKQLIDWFGHGPIGQRIVAVVSAGLAVVIVVWLALPVNGTTKLQAGGAAGSAGGVGDASAGSSSAAGDQGAATGPGAVGAVGAGGAGGSAANARGAGAGSATRGGSAAAGGGPGCPSGTDQGATAKEVTVALVAAQVAGPVGNAAVNAPPADQVDHYSDQVAQYINTHGGVGCRQLKMQYFIANPADSNDLQQKCLQIAQAKPFAVVDIGGYALTPLWTCFPEAKIPYVACCTATLSLVLKYQPYVIGYKGIIDDLYRNGVIAMQQAGSFEPAKGFKKLGVPYEDCYPDVTKKFFDSLHQIGISDSQMVTYNFGCPTLFASSSDIQQAVLKFQSSGVTHVTQMQFETNLSSFSKIAQQQGYHPVYMFGAQALGALQGALGPDPNNMDGAIAYTTDRAGEEVTPGMTPSSGTQRCDSIYGAPGTVWKSGLGIAGVVCNMLMIIQTGMNNAPSFERTSLAAGLLRVGSMQFSFPVGDGNFAGQPVPYGGQYYHAIRFTKDCTCWRVVSDFRPLLR